MSECHQTVADILYDEIIKLGVEYVFLVPGAHIEPLLISLNMKKALKPIVANHELAAGLMALGYARATGKPGVVLSIGGPGASYMVGAGVAAKADKTMVLFITGDISIQGQGKRGFQDASSKGSNDSAIFQEAIGRSMICRHIEDMPEVISELWSSQLISTPFHIQIPIDIQKTKCKSIKFENNNINTDIELSPIKISKKIKTIIVIGYSALEKFDHSKLIDFVKEHKIAVVTDVKSRGIIPESAIESLGYIGFISDRRTLEVFNINSTLAVEQIIAIGVDDTLLKKYVDVSLRIVSLKPEEVDYRLYDSILAKKDKKVIEQREDWLKELNLLTAIDLEPKSYPYKVSYIEMFISINHVMPDNTVYCLDSGQIRKAGSIFLKAYFPRSIIQSDILSPMGFGICAAIGAKLASPDKPVISLFGDGSMRMHGMELSTAVRYKLPIIFILCDNQSYATTNRCGNLGEVTKLPKLDWSKYADSIGIKSFFIDTKQRFEKCLKESLEISEPVLLWVNVPALLDDEFHDLRSLECTTWLSK